MTAKSTNERILDVAEHLVQVRGYNAFSYADVSKELGIRKASLHHHYPTKADLGVALVTRYRTGFLDALATIERREDEAPARLAAYVALYRGVLRRRRMCMCGMLAADVATLPRAMRDGVARFFAENEAWLARVLEAGRSDGTLAFDGPASAAAAFVVSSLEGAMLVARGSGGLAPFDAVARRTLTTLAPPSPRKPSRRRSG